MTGNATANIRTSELQNGISLYQPWQINHVCGFDVGQQPDSQKLNSKWFIPKSDTTYGSGKQADNYDTTEFWPLQKMKMSYGFSETNYDILFHDNPSNISTKQPLNIRSFLMLDSLSLYIDDAKSRYKRLSGEDIDDSFAKRIYDVLCDSFLFVSVSRITFFKNRLKVRIIFNGREYRINYDASDPDCIFIITEKDDITVVDECIPENLVKTLRKF